MTDVASSELGISGEGKKADSIADNVVPFRGKSQTAEKQSQTPKIDENAAKREAYLKNPVVMKTARQILETHGIANTQTVAGGRELNEKVAAAGVFDSAAISRQEVPSMPNLNNQQEIRRGAFTRMRAWFAGLRRK